MNIQCKEDAPNCYGKQTRNCILFSAKVEFRHMSRLNCHECQLEILANILLTSSWLFLAGKFKNYACRIVTVILFFLPWNWSFNLCTSRHNESPVRVGMRCYLSFEERGKDFVPKFSNFFNNGREDELNVGTAIWVWKMSIAQYGHH